MRDFNITDAKSGAAFPVRVSTKASRSEIVGLMDDGALKVRLTAPPTDGKANAALIELLAEAFGVRRDQVEIVAGHTSREKIVSVFGMTPEQIESILRG